LENLVLGRNERLTRQPASDQVPWNGHSLTI
jgi:hypothetical protein